MFLVHKPKKQIGVMTQALALWPDSLDESDTVAMSVQCEEDGAEHGTLGGSQSGGGVTLWGLHVSLPAQSKDTSHAVWSFQMLSWNKQTPFWCGVIHLKVWEAWTWHPLWSWQFSVQTCDILSFHDDGGKCFDRTKCSVSFSKARLRLHFFQSMRICFCKLARYKHSF